MDRFDKFKTLNEKYESIFRKNLSKGLLPMKSTKFGFWGTASIINLFEFFTKVGLENYDHFLDLGSGDGRAVLLASLFTNASGVEGDGDLINHSLNLQKQLGLSALFHCKNYLNHDLSNYDFVFIYPDKAFDEEIEDKLKDEITGELYIYNNLYLPKSLKKQKQYG